MSKQDELGMDMAEMAAATAAFSQNMDTDPANIPLEQINEALEPAANPEPAPSLDSDTEFENGDFWGNKAEPVEIPSELDAEPEALIEEPELSPSTGNEPFRYKANGEDVEFDISSESGLARARKALEREAGMDKAFSQSAKLEKQVKQLQADMVANSQYKDNWNKIEDLKHNRKAMLEFITGESYEDIMAKEVAQQNAYDLGTDDERRIIDYKRRIQDVEIGQKQDKARSERLAAEANEAEDRAFKLNLKSSMEREFFKQTRDMTFSEDSTGNKVKNAIWNMAANDLKAYQVKYGRLTPKMFEKAFRENAAVYGRQSQEQIDSGVSKAIEAKKAAAKEKAQLSSTRNYGGNLAETDLVGLDPSQIFKKMFRK